MGDVHHIEDRVGDLELLERVGAGDARAANELIARHLEAVRALDETEPVAAGREVLRQVLGGARLGVPFRAAWLTALADFPVSDDPLWTAYLALSPEAQVAVWHHEVEGEHPQVVGMHLGVARREVDAVLASAYDGLGVGAGARLRGALASGVLGERAEDYLAHRRPEPVEVEGEVASVGRVPVLVMVAAGLAVAGVAASALVAGVTAPTDPGGPLAAAQVIAPGRVIEAEVRRPAEPRQAVAVVPLPVATPPGGTSPAAAPHVEVQEVAVPEPPDEPAEEPTEEPKPPVERPEPPVEDTRLLDVDLGTGTVTADVGLPGGALVVQLPIVLGGR